jgi:hypothetical protein
MERVGLVGELIAFIWHRKVWWLLPTVLALLLIAVLVGMSQGAALGPLIYPLF